MKCPKCGNKMPEGSHFCGICGTKIGDSATPKDNKLIPKKKKMTGRHKTILAVIVIPLLFIGYHQYNHYTTREANYPKAIELAQQEKWEKVSSFMIGYKNDGIKYNSLYNYALAREAMQEHDVELAESYMKDVSDDDMGVLKDDVVQFRAKVNKDAAEFNKLDSDTQLRIKEQILNSKIMKMNKKYGTNQ